MSSSIITELLTIVLLLHISTSLLSSDAVHIKGLKREIKSSRHCNYALFLTRTINLVQYPFRFLVQMGIVGSSLYNVSLSVYYVSVIKFGVKDKDFRRKIEFWCHFIPNAFAICSSIFLQVGGYFNSMGGESFDNYFFPIC